MTELLYQTDSYLQEFDANVLSVLTDERAVLLDRTAFYPGGGAQPCDLRLVGRGKHDLSGPKGEEAGR